MTSDRAPTNLVKIGYHTLLACILLIMASTHRAPKQWMLSKNESITSFNSWRQNLIYTLSCDDKFTEFLVDDARWEKKTKANAKSRGFIGDGLGVEASKRRTAAQKVIDLELMLGQIANFCPVIARNSIVNHSTSLSQIWQTIRLHYGFQTTGAHFLDLANIQLEAEEKPEDLYQRILAFVDDNLLKPGCNITHHGEEITEEEDIQPSLENMVVLIWLQLLHKDLPKLVKQKYGPDLRSSTLASIKPEISQALESLLEELANSSGRVLRTNTSFQKPRSKLRKTPSSKQCPICKQAGRSDYSHFLSACRFLPESDRKYLLKARQISEILDQDASASNSEEEEEQHTACRVLVQKSPYLDMFYHHHTIRVTIDSGICICIC